jgi:hypothetical protein
MMVLAFYDLQTKNLVYLIKPMSHGPKILTISKTVLIIVFFNKDIAKIS